MNYDYIGAKSVLKKLLCNNTVFIPQEIIILLNVFLENVSVRNIYDYQSLAYVIHDKEYTINTNNDYVIKLLYNESNFTMFKSLFEIIDSDVNQEIISYTNILLKNNIDLSDMLLPYDYEVIYFKRTKNDKEYGEFKQITMF